MGHRAATDEIRVKRGMGQSPSSRMRRLSWVSACCLLAPKDLACQHWQPFRASAFQASISHYFWIGFYELHQLGHIQRQMNDSVFYKDILGIKNIWVSNNGCRAFTKLIQRRMGTTIAGFYFYRGNLLSIGNQKINLYMIFTSGCRNVNNNTGVADCGASSAPQCFTSVFPRWYSAYQIELRDTVHYLNIAIHEKASSSNLFLHEKANWSYQ